MIAVAPTDIEWFSYLRQRENKINEFNFWTPTPWNIKKINKGDKFYFLLKSPYRKIGGYGYFKYYKNLSITDAWKKFGKSNGVEDLQALIKKTSKYVHKNTEKKVSNNDYKIGCIVLQSPRFLMDEGFYSLNDIGIDFPGNIVKLKYFEHDLESQINNKFRLVNEDKVEYSKNKVKKRHGQRIFREKLIKAYEGRCAITDETCIEVLEAAHIQPYINRDSNDVRNGILLRSDLHKLFDEGLITIGTNYNIILSDKLKSNQYKQYSNRSIRLPKNKIDYPNSLALKYHNRYIFRSNNRLV
ncbi:HNH endonuclease [Clostridiaceae bacterium M8S5]|nr:HNH endonuclease [Clostridiaceae bacterium M8S5]